jgi:hypothetical protein
MKIKNLEYNQARNRHENLAVARTRASTAHR